MRADEFWMMAVSLAFPLGFWGLFWWVIYRVVKRRKEESKALLEIRDMMREKSVGTSEPSPL